MYNPIVALSLLQAVQAMPEPVTITSREADPTTITIETSVVCDGVLTKVRTNRAAGSFVLKSAGLEQDLKGPPYVEFARHAWPKSISAICGLEGRVGVYLLRVGLNHQGELQGTRFVFTVDNAGRIVSEGAERSATGEHLKDWLD